MHQRLYAITLLLTQRGSTTAGQLAARFGVSRRTIYRDIDALSAAGVPVYTQPGKGGGIHMLPGYTIDRALFSEEEQAQLVANVGSLASLGAPGAEDLLDKLAAVFGRRDSWLEVDFAPWGAGAEMRAGFALLRDAILGRRVVAFDYVSASAAGSRAAEGPKSGERGAVNATGVAGDNATAPGQSHTAQAPSPGTPSGVAQPPPEAAPFSPATRRSVEPVRVVFRGQGWYLYAWCRTRQAWRFFKLSRMSRLALTGEGFAPRTPPPADAPYTGPSVRVRLRFAPGAAFRVLDEFSPAQLAPAPGGGWDVEADFPWGDGWLVGYILSFGPAAEVLDPPLLRQRVAEALGETTARYTGGDGS